MKALYNWFAYRLPLRKKLLTSFSLLSMIPILVLGIYSYHQSKINTEQQIRSTMQSNLDRLSSELDTRFQRESSTIRFLAYNLVFRNALENSGKDTIAMARVMNDSIEPNFWYFIAGDTYVKGIQVYSSYVSNTIGDFLYPTNETIEHELWYQQALEDYSTHWSFNGDEIYATRAILDTNSSSKVIAVLRISFYPFSLLDAADSMNYLSNGIQIVDQNGNTVYFKSCSNESLDEDVATMVPNNTNATVPGSALLYVGSMDISSWSIYYYLDESNVTRELYPIIRTTLLVVAVCLLIALFLINWLANVLTNRILHLQTYAEYIADGKFDWQISTTDTDEIGIVTNSMGQMAHRLNAMIHQVYQLEIEKKGSELRALQAMINPHFLYNSLSNIKWKALRAGNDDICEITGLLAKFYRSCLNNGQPLTTVQMELENISAYIKIQQLTHDNSFDVTYDIAESQLHYPMLNFMLQPIVENAIKHGLEYKSETDKGCIRVECHGDGSYIIFRIINNGEPLDLHRVAEVMKTPGSSYGIYNICERIDLYYDEGSGLYPSITENGETCFTLKLNNSSITKKDLPV